MPFSITILDVILALVGLALLRRLTSRTPAPYPPGPKGLPLIGNLLDIPSEQPWKTVADWGELYGDIVYINVLGNPFVFLNSPQAAADMLDKKSVIYSDRPTLTFATELAGYGKTVPLTQFGEEVRAMRRLLHSYMGTHIRAHKLSPMAEYETKGFLRRILNDPDQFDEAIRRTAGGIILQITYGYEPKDHGDPLIELISRAMEHLATMTVPGAFLVDVIPTLKYIPAWFPGAQFKRIASEAAQCLHDSVETPLNHVKEQMATGAARPSFTSRCLGGQGVTAEQEYIIKWAAAGMYGGGADTTVSSINTFFLSMMVYPDVQKKAQAEIDAIIGNGRLPCLTDMERLPYVEALVKEVFRWHPVIPLCVPHSPKEDDIHDGYLIPKGAAVVTNIWGFLHDPKIYANPMAFNPERFLGSHPEQDPREYCFGFGRRVCPGRHFAYSSVWLSCAMSLAVFTIAKPTDASGHLIEPVVDFTSKAISHPIPFKCSITPRSDATRLLILAEDEGK
ncbi:cytochrome P450 [Neolentinus lepideus HHB14362 ss-1]|uniref:Cytochrome P450 n=1 Tax=Neolentinus lepideus HHB14362 ss-1 TaxID=1314782 RepID=A0A165UV98_9AGAM|nr:cytochrome P450 [Neolentinus lepideus HHB14362 ss-1]